MLDVEDGDEQQQQGEGELREHLVSLGGSVGTDTVLKTKLFE